jgi:hypothetical protein
MLDLVRPGRQPEVHLKDVVEAQGAQPFVDRRPESHIQKHRSHLMTWSLVFEDLGQPAHQHAAIARVLARDPDPRDRSGIPTTAEGRNVPGGAAATNVHATDQRLVEQALR